MIDDLSRTLEGLLSRPGLPPELSLATISFDSPAPPFNPGVTTVNLFLYDIQENVDLRSNEPIIERQNNQAIKKSPPMRLECSYLATAWPAAGVGSQFLEHLLLAQVLAALAPFPQIPDGFLVGTLAGQEPLPPMTVARGDELRHNAEFWTALGGKLRPSVRICVTVSIPVFADKSSFVVTTKSVKWIPGQNGVTSDDLVQIGGRITDPLGAGVEGAIIDILDAGLRARAGADGRYSFPLVPVGTRQFRVIATAFQVIIQNRPVPGSPGDYNFVLTP